MSAAPPSREVFRGNAIQTTNWPALRCNFFSFHTLIFDLITLTSCCGLKYCLRTRSLPTVSSEALHANYR